MVDIIDAFRYQETSYDKKTFMAYIKDYMKACRPALREPRFSFARSARRPPIPQQLTPLRRPRPTPQRPLLSAEGRREAPGGQGRGLQDERHRGAQDRDPQPLLRASPILPPFLLPSPAAAPVSAAAASPTRTTPLSPLRPLPPRLSEQELQFFLGESGDMEGSMVYAYYKEGASEPTFLLFKDALKEVKC